MRRNKYNNKKVTINGITFDSILESKRWIFLQSSKKVSSIKRQASFVVATYGNKQIKYRADFVVEWKSGYITTEDVKGVKTPLYILKAALMWEKYDINVLEIDKYNLTCEF